MSQSDSKPFRIKLPFEPAGDQPKAIERITTALLEGKKAQVLLGITGSGKTMIMASKNFPPGTRYSLLSPRR